jgi:RND family efflux transporter MFP subunit
VRGFKLFVLILVAMALAAGGWWWWRGLPPNVALVTAERGPAVEAVYATGTVEPVRWAAIASTETGRIAEYPVEEGQAVEEGEVLIHLDDATLTAEYEALMARVRFLAGDVERYQQLLRNQNISRQAYDRALSELEQAEAAAAAARQRLDDFTIRAPIQGVVLQKDREVGEVLEPGDVLVWIGQDRPYWITAQVDEEDIPRVAVGQTALIKADAFPGTTFEGIVSEITPKGDPVDKQYRVRVLLPAESPLMIGMTTEINVVVRREDAALLLPESAVIDGSVFIVEQGVARRLPVTVGVYGDRKVEIRAGLESDTEVIANPPEGLRDGMPVDLVARSGTEQGGG